MVYNQQFMWFALSKQENCPYIHTYEVWEEVWESMGWLVRVV